MSGSRQDESDSALARAIVEDISLERIEHLQGPESSGGAELGKLVGKNLRAIRNELELSIDDIAQRSSIDRAVLEALEEGEMIPSMRALWHVATALGIPFGALLEGESEKTERHSDFQVQRSDDGRVIASSDDKFRSRVLFPEGDRRSPEVYELTLAPGCLERAAAHATSTYEHITVVQGTLRVVVGDNVATLSRGDSIFFSADQAHGYENPGSIPAVAHLVVTFGTDSPLPPH